MEKPIAVIPEYKYYDLSCTSIDLNSISRWICLACGSGRDLEVVDGSLTYMVSNLNGWYIPSLFTLVLRQEMLF